MKKNYIKTFFVGILVASFLIFAATASAEDIYVPGHHSTIQGAIDAASDLGDTIIVAAGTYSEYLIITKDYLTIQGAGIDQSIIDLDELMPYWHYRGQFGGSPSGSYASRAGVLISGYGSPDQIVEGVTFKGFTVKNAGLNPPDIDGDGDVDSDDYYHFYDQYGDGQDDVRGISIGNGNDIIIQNCEITDSGYGAISTGYARCVSTHKYSENITITDCIIKDHPHAGISIGNNAGTFTVTNNVCENIKQPHFSDPTREYMGYGIQVTGTKNYGMASGVISGNTCKDNGFIGIMLKKYIDGVYIEDNEVTGHNSDQDGAGIFIYHSGHPEWCKNITIRNNTITGNIRGIVAYYASESTIEGNIITTDSGIFDPGQAAIKLDNANNIEVKNNTISSCDGPGITVQSYDSAHNSSDNFFTGNKINNAMFAGVFIYGPYAQGNTFENNFITGTTVLTIWDAWDEWRETQADGVFIDHDGGTGHVFNYNNINNNDGDGMENQVGTVDATNNWWGDCTGPYHLTNPTGGGDAVSDGVNYNLWLGGSLCALITAINDLDDDTDFKKLKAADGQRAGLLDMVDSVSGRLNDGQYQSARRMLTRQITRAIEKWINDPAEAVLSNHIVDVIAEIGLLEGP